jgi:hypothetical protein
MLPDTLRPFLISLLFDLAASKSLLQHGCLYVFSFYSHRRDFSIFKPPQVGGKWIKARSGGMGRKYGGIRLNRPNGLLCGSGAMRVLIYTLWISVLRH